MKTPTDRATEAIEAAEMMFAEDTGATLDPSPAAKAALIAKIASAIQAAVAEQVGLGLTVIPTCHAAEMGKLHFDIRHLNTLEWNTPADLADKLNKRIRAVVGVGPNADHS